MTTSGPGTDGAGAQGGRTGSTTTTTGDHSAAIGQVGPNATFNLGGIRFRKDVAWLAVLASVVIVATVGFTVFAVVHWPGGPQNQYTGFYVLVVVAVLVAGAATLYPADRAGQVRDEGQARAEAKRRKVVRSALTVVSALCCGGGALAWVDVDRTGEVGVEMHISGAQPVGHRGDPLTVEMLRPLPGDVRDSLRLRLTIEDDDPDTPTCVGRTTATITAVTSGISPGTKEVPTTSTVDFDLGGREGAVRFEVAVHTETGCAMRLAQARGTLHND
ncbi:hypothetical protein ACFYWS_28565 [Streptomyces sp. NPDC002795]|uniref:hypothetical protein n=1 Tax=Streptomyces sp. NPDC002795 TaxID=3364665 RepID=UPI0036C98A7B